MQMLLAIISTLRLTPASKRRTGKRKVHAPSLLYKIYLHDDDERVHACRLLHRKGYEERKLMHAHARHYQQKYLSNPRVQEGVLVLSGVRSHSSAIGQGGIS
jgi:hypothetical protein